MNLSSVIPAIAAAERVGCTPAHIRGLIRSGELPAKRVGHQWFIDESLLDRVNLGGSYSGRTLSQHLSWSLLADLEGRAIIFSLHRQERARLAQYRAQPHDQLCHRLRGRALLIPMSASSASVARLRADARWVIGGSEAAARYAQFAEMSGTPTFYVRKSFEEDFLDASLAVRDEFAPNLYLALVADQYWPFDNEIDRYVWGSVAYLDCREQRLVAPQMELLWPPLTGILDISGVVTKESDTRGEDADT